MQTKKSAAGRKKRLDNSEEVRELYSSNFGPLYLLKIKFLNNNGRNVSGIYPFSISNCALSITTTVADVLVFSVR